MTETSLIAAAADAALALAAERPWADVTWRDVIARAGIDFVDAYGVVRSKSDLVDALARRFDRAAAGGLDLNGEASARERVFDAVMARFDAMEPHRPGLVSILKGEGGDLARALAAAKRTRRTARWLLELAGLDTSGLAGAARINGLVVILSRTTAAWIDDEAGDLARTMSTLDRHLRDVEDWAGRMRSRRARPAAPTTDHGSGPQGFGPDADRPAEP